VDLRQYGYIAVTNVYPNRAIQAPVSSTPNTMIARGQIVVDKRCPINSIFSRAVDRVTSSLQSFPRPLVPKPMNSPNRLPSGTCSASHKTKSNHTCSRIGRLQWRSRNPDPPMETIYVGCRFREGCRGWPVALVGFKDEKSITNVTTVTECVLR
jgi:hypothetical protein